MKVVVALGGNALLRRGEPMTAQNQRANVRAACRSIAPLAADHDLVISHGNGPQVGLLALQGAAYKGVDPYPLDILGAQTEGMIGYLIQQELGNLLPAGRRIASLLTMVEVDREDPAFANPTKPIGPIYTAAEAEALARDKGWVLKPDGEHMRRVVPSPVPRQIFGVQPIEWLLEHRAVVTCAGGGGMPVMYTDHEVPAGRELVGVEAVIDKDLASALLAIDLGADVLLIVTDVDAVYLDWGTPQRRAVRRATPQALAATGFAEGSMGPKVGAACWFVEQTGRPASIGSIDDTAAMLRGDAGTTITTKATGLEAEGDNP
ncbi:carbamate kinase [Nocardioides ungokensis]|uniref:carbamate kinase n=1 Tax=Nocardioides ungokensis TaxID=1643322 RepID=UPI0015DEE622|nr:carbamate kinase [Nocardioides ungokensis]